MKETFTSKLSLYDILSMVIPGAFLTLFIDRLFNMTINKWAENWINTFIFLILSYFLGIISYRIVEILLNKESLKEIRCNHIEDIIPNNKKVLLEVKRKVKEEFKCSIPNKAGENILYQYYYAYYYVLRHTNRGGVINIVESQISFLKSMTMVFIVGAICCVLSILNSNADYNNFLLILIFVSFVFSVFVILFIIGYMQRKVYSIVWEEYLFLTELNKSQNNN